MNQSAGTNGPNDERSSPPGDGPAPYVPESEIPAVSLPRTMPLEEPSAGDVPGGMAETPPLGVEEPGDDAWGGREPVESVYGPLTEVYERLEARLRQVPEDVPPVGWAPHLAALRALREKRVTGDWETLARLLVAPGSLPAGTGQIRLVQVKDEADEAATIRTTVRDLLAESERALLLAPTQDKADALVQSMQDDPEICALLIETRPRSPEDDEPPGIHVATPGGEETVAQAVVTGEMLEREAAKAPPPREFGSNGTVEFKPVSGPPAPREENSSEITPVEGLPVVPDLEETVQETAVRETDLEETVTGHDPAPEKSVAADAPPAPETWVRTAAVRPVGEAWGQSWRTEARLLQRGLMWLEQWPRDATALEAVQAENLRRREALDGELAALAEAIEESRTAVTAAKEAARQAEAEAGRLVAVQREAEEELAGPRAEAERLQAAADATAAEASALTRTADAAQARCARLAERAAAAQAEEQAARRLAASLTDELARAREALPAAAEEADRLAAADADAAAEGHAAYYRMVSAESTLSALRRHRTLGQRLHVASPPSGLSGLRAEVKARVREADEAARRAKGAKDAAEQAQERRQGLAAFVSEGGTRLAAAEEAQERLGTELTWLATERRTAGAEYQEQARLAAEAVDRATQASLEARAARQAAQAIEERVAAARSAREEALTGAGRAWSEAEAAGARAVQAEAELERRTAEAEAEMAARTAELDTASEAEARSRENVREICGSDPGGEPELISTHQGRAMARVEQLTGFLEGTGVPDGQTLLRTADLVIGTPVGAGTAAADEEFDALIVAGEVTDAEFLIGAVRTRRWILVGEPGARPPAYREYAAALAATDAAAGPGVRLESGPLERGSVAAPHLLA